MNILNILILKKRGDILNNLIMKKGGNIKKIDLKKGEEYIEYIDHEKKGGIYWIFQSPLGGHSSKGSQQPGSQRFHLQCSPTTGFWRSFFHFGKWIMQEVDWQGILGGPIRVQVSISLRNILEIDELRQVAKNDEIANFLSNVFFQMSAIN